MFFIPQKKTRTGGIWALTLLFLISLFLDGCGSSDDSISSPTVETDESSAELATDTNSAQEIAAAPSYGYIPQLPDTFQPPSPPPPPQWDAEGTLTSADFYQCLYTALLATQIQLSHTGEGEPIFGQPSQIVVGPPPAYKLEIFEQACADADDPLECLQEHLSPKVKTIIPRYDSYVKWGSLLKTLNPDLEDTPLYLPRITKSLPKKVSITGGGLTLGAFTINRIRASVNYIHTTVSPDTFSASIGDGRLNFGLAFETGQPTLICEGHAVGWSLVLDGFSKWADEFCPDVEVSNMAISVRLFPVVTSDGQLGYSSVQADFSADLNLAGFPDALITAFHDYKASLKNQVESAVESALRKKAVKEALSDAFTDLIDEKFGAAARQNQSAWYGIQKIVSVKVEGDHLLVRYVKKKPQAKVFWSSFRW